MDEDREKRAECSAQRSGEMSKAALQDRIEAEDAEIVLEMDQKLLPQHPKKERNESELRRKTEQKELAKSEPFVEQKEKARREAPVKQTEAEAAENVFEMDKRMHAGAIP